MIFNSSLLDWKVSVKQFIMKNKNYNKFMSNSKKNLWNYKLILIYNKAHSNKN